MRFDRFFCEVRHFIPSSTLNQLTAMPFSHDPLWVSSAFPNLLARCQSSELNFCTPPLPTFHPAFQLLCPLGRGGGRVINYRTFYIFSTAPYRRSLDILPHRSLPSNGGRQGVNILSQMPHSATLPQTGSQCTTVEKLRRHKHTAAHCVSTVVIKLAKGCIIPCG